MLYPAELRARCGAALLPGESGGRKCIASFFMRLYANRMIRLLFALALAPLVAACAADRTVYPSLAPRAGEGAAFAEPATPPPAPVVRDPALDGRIADAVAKRVAAARAFDRAAARADTLVRAARGAMLGSDRWIEAQTAIAELDALRSAHADPIATLEDMSVTRAQALLPEYAALDDALDAARAVAREQTQRIDALSAALPAA